MFRVSRFHRLFKGVHSLRSGQPLYASDFTRGVTTDFSDKSFPSGSEVVIAGGGVVGCSIAYHLGKICSKDVVLLEQGSIGSGTTWHAAGLLGALKSTHSQTLLSKYAVDLYPTLEEETGQGTGFKRNGSLHVAKSKDRATYFKRLAETSRQFGIDCHIVSPSEITKLWPLLNVTDIKMGLYVPNDGVATSSDVCNAFLKGARQRGVKVLEKTKVKRVLSDGRKVVGVETDKGYIECKYFVNACGQWSRELGMLSEPRVHVPLHSCEHFYIVTKAMENVHDMLPTLRDQDLGIYVREWSGGLMCGGFETKAKPCFYDRIPDDFEFQLLAEDWPHFMEHFMEGLLERIPDLQKAEIRQFLCGPESFTADGFFLVGEVPELRNYYVGAAMNSNGIVCGGGVGKAISELIVEGKTSLDISNHDIRRMPRDGINKMYLRDSVSEALGRHYAIPYPKDCIRAARPMKTSPFYDSQTAKGAKWSVVCGWERADWFSDDSRAQARTFGKPPWLESVRRELKASQDAVGFLDLSWESVLEISGKDLSLLLEDMQYLFATDIDVPVNTVTQSALLDHSGRYYGIVKLIRTSAHSYLAIMLPEFETKFTSWIRNNAKYMSNLKVVPLNGSMTRLALLGKKAGDILGQLCHPDEAIQNLEINHSKVLDVGYASGVGIIRGFLDDDRNWELVVPSQYSIGLRRLIMDLAGDSEVTDIGHYAIETLQITKAIVGYDVPISKGRKPKDLLFPYFVDTNKPQDFIGKSENVQATGKAKTQLKQLHLASVDDDSWVWGGEPVMQNGQHVSDVVAAAWNYEKGVVTALAFVPSDVECSGLELLVAGRSYPVQALS